MTTPREFGQAPWQPVSARISALWAGFRPTHTDLQPGPPSIQRWAATLLQHRGRPGGQEPGARGSPWSSHSPKPLRPQMLACFVPVQLLSHAQLFVTLMDRSTPGFSVLHSPRVCSNSRPLHQRCHPTISSSVIPFFSYPQSFPAPGSFPMSWLFASGGQNSAASASVLPMDILFHEESVGLLLFDEDELS